MTYRAELVRDADRAACNASPGPWRVERMMACDGSVTVTIVDAQGGRVGTVNGYYNGLAIVSAFNLVAEAGRDQALKDELERSIETMRAKAAEAEEKLGGAKTDLEDEIEDLEDEIERKKADLAELTRKVDAAQSAGGVPA